MIAKVLIHWPGLHHAQVDSAIMDHCVGSLGGTLAAVTTSQVSVFSEQYRSVTEAIALNPTLTPVFLVPESDAPSGSWTTLHKYIHPEDALYVLGADGGFGYDVPTSGGEFVAIEGPNGPNHSMWSYQVATIVLYDRWLMIQEFFDKIEHGIEPEIRVQA